MSSFKKLIIAIVLLIYIKFPTDGQKPFAAAAIKTEAKTDENGGSAKFSKEVPHRLRGNGVIGSLDLVGKSSDIVTDADLDNTPDSQLTDISKTTEGNTTKWIQGQETEPMSEDDLDELMAHLPKYNFLKDMNRKPGKGLGRNNLKALLNSGKPLFLNGLDEEVRDTLEVEMKLKIDHTNQPYLIIIPKKEKHNQVAFHVIEAMAPLYDTLDGESFKVKRNQHLLDFLDMADKADAEHESSNRIEEGRKLINNNEATPTYSHRYSRGTYNIGRVSRYWDSTYVDYYQTTNGHEIIISHSVNWDTTWPFTNGKMSTEVFPPDDTFSLYNSWPGNSNGQRTLSAQDGVTLNGESSWGCSTDGTCTAGMSSGSSRSQSRTVSFTATDWKVLNTGPAKWEFSQDQPFPAGNIYGNIYDADYTPLSYPTASSFQSALPDLTLEVATLRTVSHFIRNPGENGWKYIPIKNSHWAYNYQWPYLAMPVSDFYELDGGVWAFVGPPKMTCNVHDTGDTVDCCTSTDPCGLGEGDCDGDSQCFEGLICGTDNCLRDWGWGTQHHDCCIPEEPTIPTMTCYGNDAGDTVDCCVTRLCGAGEGDCDGDSQCAEGLICGTDNCQSDWGWGTQYHDCCMEEWSTATE